MRSTSSGACATALFVLALATHASAQAQATPLVVVSPTGCPSAGEIQAALGDEVAVIESPTAPTPEVRAVIGVAEVTSIEGSYRVRVELPGQPPLERSLPHADCATAARLVAIVIRGVDFRAAHEREAAREALEGPGEGPERLESPERPGNPGENPGPEPSFDPAPEAIPEAASSDLRFDLGIATGLGLEISPTNGSWTEQVDLGLSYRALAARLALIAATPTQIALETEGAAALERISFGARIDVGARIDLDGTFAIGGRLGVGVLLASLASPTFAPNQFFRVTPTVGMQLFGEAHLDGSLFLFLEVGLDVPVVRDAYALAGVEIGAAPAVLQRSLVGIRVIFP